MEKDKEGSATSPTPKRVKGVARSATSTVEAVVSPRQLSKGAQDSKDTQGGAIRAHLDAQLLSCERILNSFLSVRLLRRFNDDLNGSLFVTNLQILFAEDALPFRMESVGVGSIRKIKRDKAEDDKLSARIMIECKEVRALTLVVSKVDAKDVLEALTAAAFPATELELPAFTLKKVELEPLVQDGATSAPIPKPSKAVSSNEAKVAVTAGQSEAEAASALLKANVAPQLLRTLTNEGGSAQSKDAHGGGGSGSRARPSKRPPPSSSAISVTNSAAKYATLDSEQHKTRRASSNQQSSAITASNGSGGNDNSNTTDTSTDRGGGQGGGAEEDLVAAVRAQTLEEEPDLATALSASKGSAPPRSKQRFAQKFDANELSLHNEEDKEGSEGGNSKKSKKEEKAKESKEKDKSKERKDKDKGKSKERKDKEGDPKWDLNGWTLYASGSEYTRLGLTSGSWRISDLNKEYAVCPSYPRQVVVPQSIDDARMSKVAGFRTSSRMPAVTWRHPTNEAVLVRCSQPMPGLVGHRGVADEDYFETLYQLNVKGKRVAVLDTRPKLNASANRLMGGGSENAKYYKHMDIEFHPIENIHKVRDSWKLMRDLCTEVPFGESIEASNPEFEKEVEECGWYEHIKVILSAVYRVRDLMDVDSVTVVVHCSDGWDRTAQTVSLSQLLMDKYYRTIEGLIVLIEKEWASFGHQFALREGHGKDMSNYQHEQRSPIFLQFVECLYQLLAKYPKAFEFNERLLLLIMEHFHAGTFGTFLFDHDQDRSKHALASATHSLWSLVLLKRSLFVNEHYNPNSFPFAIGAIFDGSFKFWRAYWLRYQFFEYPTLDERRLPLVLLGLYPGSPRPGSTLSATTLARRSQRPTKATTEKKQKKKDKKDKEKRNEDL